MPNARGWLEDTRASYDTLTSPESRQGGIILARRPATDPAPASHDRESKRLDWAASAAGSVQAELPGTFSAEHDREVAAYVAGEIDAAELYRRTTARYRRA